MFLPSEKQASFELLFDRTPIPMWVFDENSLEFLAVNDAALARYGFSRDEFMEMSLPQLCTDARIPDSPEMDDGEEPPVRKGRARIARKGDVPVDTSLTFSVLPFEGREAVLTTVDERSDSSHAEARSREQANLLDLASDAIMVCDLDGRVTSWNQGAFRLYGWTPEEALGSEMVDLLMPDPTVLVETERGVRETGFWSGQLTQQNKDGRKVIVNSRWTLVRDDEGKPASVLVINTDLTEQKNLESQFLRTQRLESIGTLASGIAHDLNNILSPILMSVAVLRRNVKEPENEKILSIIESSAERGAGIVKQVLTFARGVEGERVLLQPKHLISEMAKILAQTFPRHLDIRTHFAPDLWMVTGDATQLHQVLLNLCVNARDAMPKGGTLSVTGENVTVDQHFVRMNPSAQLGDYVILKVNDTGDGMSAETMDKIFDPFFTTKEVGKGTGLGLATVIGIVKTHGGFLTVQSEIGVGTTFRIFLPATDKSGVEDTKATDTEDDLRGQGELILVVDDEPPIREALVQTLQDNGYRAYTAEDGSDAMALYFQRKNEIKLVLTDLAMAQMDGVALVRALRRFDPTVKVVVSSGHCPPDQVILLEGLGVKRFLDKPYTATKLLRILHDALHDKPIVKKG